MKIVTEAYEAFVKGVNDGTIKHNEQQVCEWAIEQEVVSFCSSKGTYMFDFSDVVDYVKYLP